MGAQALPQAAFDLVKKAEGCRLVAYRCPAGRWTCGYGATGPDVYEGVRWTQAQAEARLQADLTAAAAAVDRLVKVPLTANQRGALASFVFNLGSGSLQGSTLLRKLNAKDYQGAADEFPKWVYSTVVRPDGTTAKEVLPGLVVRRAAERALFMTP